MRSFVFFFALLFAVEGCGAMPFLAYDAAHGVLHASMFSGGVARRVVP